MAKRKNTQSACKRPDSVRAPAHWHSDTAPDPVAMLPVPADQQPGNRDPVRYGDWEYKGLAIDF